jgi:hypothetical protein
LSAVYVSISKPRAAMSGKISAEYAAMPDALGGSGENHARRTFKLYPV